MSRLSKIGQLAFWCVVMVVGLTFYLYAQTRQSGPQPVADTVRTAWQAAKRWVVESVDAMPEADYSFKPVATVRTYGQILGHLAGANYEICSAAKGEKSPHAEGAFESLATKAAIKKALTRQLSFEDLAARVPEQARSEQEQFEQDKKHMKTRLAELDKEKETEPAAVQALYEVVLKRLQPVGLVVLWPESRLGNGRSTERSAR